MSISAEKIIERNWEEVKNEMRKTWRSLSEDQISEINNYTDLVKQLKKSYGITEEKVMQKIDKFIDKFDLQPNLTRFEEFKNSLYENAEAAKDKIEDVFKNSIHDIREKTEDWSHEAINYTKENPLKILGLGILAAVTIKAIVKKK